MSVLEADYYQGWGEGAYSNDLHVSQQAGDVCVFRFEGTEVELCGPTGERYGIAAIAVDGGEEKLVDCYSAEDSHRVLLYSSGPLADGPHTVRIRVTGERRAVASDSYVAVDEALVSQKTAARAGDTVAQTEESLSRTDPPGD
jgi:hypothetical protein